MKESLMTLYGTFVFMIAISIGLTIFTIFWIFIFLAYLLYDVFMG